MRALQREVLAEPPDSFIHFRNGNPRDCRRASLYLRNEGTIAYSARHKGRPFSVHIYINRAAYGLRDSFRFRSLDAPVSADDARTLGALLAA